MPVAREIAADRVLIEARPRADLAEFKPAQASDAATIEPLEEDRVAGNDPKVTSERQHRLAIQKVFIEGLEAVKAAS